MKYFNYVTQTWDEIADVKALTDEQARQYVPQQDNFQNRYLNHRLVGDSVAAALSYTLSAVLQQR